MIAAPLSSATYVIIRMSCINYCDSRIDVIHVFSVAMAVPKLTKCELQIMNALWTKGLCSVREIQESFAVKGRPAFTTVQTTVYRLERKKALRRVKQIGKANVFEAAISREMAESTLIDELLGLLSGRGKPVMAHLIKRGEVTIEDVKEAEQTLRRLKTKQVQK